MIIKENASQYLLPLYEVQELSAEEALFLLEQQHNNSGETLISRAGNRLRSKGEADRLQIAMECLF